MRLKGLMTAVAAAFLASGFSGASAADIKIGFSIDDMHLERWARDRDYFVEAAKKLNAEVNVQSADANEQRQISQIENMVSRGAKTIVIVPFNSKVLGNVIADARGAGVKILSYDRLIMNADVDAYISFDNVRVGAMQAEGLVRLVPKGNYYLLGGAPTDNNARLLRQGQLSTLAPFISRGDIKVVGEQWVKDWLPANALAIVENALTATDNKIDAIVASNDSTAGGAIQALAAQGLAGKVAVSGQDADLAAVKRVVDGTQALTVYKPLKLIATEAARLSVMLAKGETPEYNASLDNGYKKVDSLLLTPVVVSKDNVDVLVKDGFYTREQIYGK